jgi:hypothetical protein
MKAIVTTSTDLNNYPIWETAQVSKNFEYIAFSSFDGVSGWCVHSFKNLKDIPSDMKKLSRIIKICTHRYLQGSESYLYLDSKFTHIQFNIDAWFNMQALEEYDLVLMRHPKRNCIYAEGRAIISGHKDTPDIINKQLAQYKAEGMPERYGLWAPGIYFKKNTPAVNKFMELWWKEIEKHSHRDIPSFSYCKWKYRDLFSSIKFKDIDFRETTKLFYGAF